MSNISPNEIRDMLTCPDAVERVADAINAAASTEPPRRSGIKNISLGFVSVPDARAPKTVRLMVQDEDFKIDLLVDLSEHDFTSLLSGQNVKVEAKIG